MLSLKRAVSFTMIVAGASYIASPAAAQEVKTAKACNDELKTNWTQIEAAKETIREFIHACWNSPPGTATPIAGPGTRQARNQDVAPATFHAVTPAGPGAAQGNTTWAAPSAGQAKISSAEDAVAQPWTKKAENGKKGGWERASDRTDKQPWKPKSARFTKREAPWAPTRSAQQTWAPTRSAQQTWGEPPTGAVQDPLTPSAAGTAQEAWSPGSYAYKTEVSAKQHCGAETVVWMNTRSKIYHYPGTFYYGHTRIGAFMCERDATTAGGWTTEWAPRASPETNVHPVKVSTGGRDESAEVLRPWHPHARAAWMSRKSRRVMLDVYDRRSRRHWVVAVDRHHLHLKHASRKGWFTIESKRGKAVYLARFCRHTCKVSGRRPPVPLA